MEKNKNTATTILTIAALGQLVLAVVFGIIGSLRHIITSRQGDILICISLLVYWALMDILEPMIRKRFENITQKQKSAYIKFILFDFAGLAGIAYFLFSMSGSGSNGILGAVVYAVSIKIKRDNQDIFYGLVPEEEEEEETSQKPALETDETEKISDEAE